MTTTTTAGPGSSGIPGPIGDKHVEDAGPIIFVITETILSTVTITSTVPSTTTLTCTTPSSETITKATAPTHNVLDNNPLAADHRLPSGAIAGIVAGTIGGLALLALLALILLRRKRQRGQASAEKEQGQGASQSSEAAAAARGAGGRAARVSTSSSLTVFSERPFGAGRSSKYDDALWPPSRRIECSEDNQT